MEIHSREFRMQWSLEEFPQKIDIMIPNSNIKTEKSDSLIVNFSRQGMFVQTLIDPRIQVGSHFDFAIQAHDLQREIRGKAEVKWVRPIEINPRMPQGIGVHLVNFSDRSEQQYQDIFVSRLFNLTVEDVYHRGVPTINLQTDLATALTIFQAYSVQTLVIVDQWFVPVGVLHQKDLFQSIGVASSQSTTVVQIMRPIMETLDPSMRVSEVFSSLKTGARFDLPVMKMNRYLGILPIELILNYWSAYSDASYQKILKNYEKALYEIAHDLRQPIGYIMTVLGLLRSGEMTFEEYRESYYQDAIDLNCNNMLSMIEEILDLPRLRLGHIKLANKSVNIREIIGSIVAKNQQLAAKKSIEIKIEMANELDKFDELLIDSRRLEQVINNLLSNAVKYSSPESGSIVIAVSMQSEELSTYKLIIKVIDHGVGIAAEHLTNLFKEGSVPFNRFLHGDESTGIGLSIVKKIVNAMGGNIEVQSEIGKGTVFTIFLKAEFPEKLEGPKE